MQTMRNGRMCRAVCVTSDRIGGAEDFPKRRKKIIKPAGLLAPLFGGEGTAGGHGMHAWNFFILRSSAVLTPFNFRSGGSPTKDASD